MKAYWHKLLSKHIKKHNKMGDLKSAVSSPAFCRTIRCHEQMGSYPADLRAELHGLGLPEILLSGSAWDVAEFNHHLAGISGSMVITVGVNYLGLIPMFIGGSDEQKGRVAERVSEGAYTALALTEQKHGSHLLGCETFATADTINIGRHYLRGEKQTINGGSQHGLIAVLARTADQGAGAMSLFLVERDDTVTAPHRWHTLQLPALDISSIRFDNTPAELLGRKGRGFDIVQKTMPGTRAGIAVMAVGALNKATELATVYSQERVVGGTKIINHDVICDHLLAMHSADLLATSLALKTTALVNAKGPGAVYYAFAAKLLCCELAEQGIDEGRKLFGGRASLHDFPYAHLVRDVPLYGTFDGTRHIVGEQLSYRLAQLVSAGVQADQTQELAQIYSHPPQNYLEASHFSARPYFLNPAALLAGWEPLAQSIPPKLFEHLHETWGLLADFVESGRSSGRWDADQSFRYALAYCAAEFEAILALLELADAGIRARLSLHPIAGADRPAQPLVEFAIVDRLCKLVHRLEGQEPEQFSAEKLRRNLILRRKRLRSEIFENRDDIFHWGETFVSPATT